MTLVQVKVELWRLVTLVINFQFPYKASFFSRRTETLNVALGVWILTCIREVPFSRLDGKLSILTSFRQMKRVCKITKSDYWLRRVCPSVRIQQLNPHWTDFHDIWYLSVFRKSVKKIQVSLKSDKNNGYFT